MALTNEDRGGLVGAFIVEEGDEILSITQAGQVVRSPINDNFRPTGRSTMGVKFVTPKEGDAVAVVARSVEAKVVEEVVDGEAGDTPTGPEVESGNSSGTDPDVTIDETVPTEATSDDGKSDS
jgi:DNA gyrase subunit A